MRRASLLTASMALILVLATGVALAATINGTSQRRFPQGHHGRRQDRGARRQRRGQGPCRKRSRSLGGTGMDTLYGKENADLIVGGRGSDALDGGIGNDTLKSNFDGRADNLNCSQDYDTAFVEPTTSSTTTGSGAWP